MSIASAVIRKFLASIERRAAVQVYEHFNSLNPTVLRAAGLSPELLALGPDAYPWRAVEAQVNPDMPEVVTSQTTQKTQIRAAIAELESFSDSELHDLGITRQDISSVVRFGRPGIDDQVANDSQQAAA